MKLDEIRIIYRKELTETLRDRRTLVVMILLPLVLYPLILLMSTRLGKMAAERMRSTPITIAVAGDIELLSGQLEDEETPVNWLPVADAAQVELGEEIQAVVELPSGLETGRGTAKVRLRFSGSDERSRRAADLAGKALAKARTALRDRRLRAAGLPVDPGGFLAVEELDLATPERTAGRSAGKVLPMLLVLMLVSGGSVTALDMLAGEKERGTLETLLVSAVDRRSIIAGKLAVVLTTTLVTLVLSLVSVVAAAELDLVAPGAEGWRLHLTAGQLAGTLILLAPLALLFGGVLLLLSGLARSFKEGQYYMFPLILLAFVPALAAALPGVSLASIWLVVPIANAAVGIRELLVGGLSWPAAAAATAVNLAASVAVLHLAARVIGRETTLAGSAPAAGRTGAGAEAGVRDAAALFGLVWLLVFLVGSALQMREILSGLLYTLFGLLLIPSIVFLKRTPVPPARELLHWRRPAWSAWLGALVAAPALMMIAQGLLRLQSHFMPIPGELMRAFDLALVENGYPLWASVLVVALGPGICEEIFFRGVLAGVLARRVGAARTVLAVALMFGFFHFSIYRFVPTALIGAAFTWMVLASGSLWPAMLAHTAYNGLSIGLAGLETRPWLESPWMVLPGIALAAAAAGLTVAGRRRPALGRR